MRGGVGVVVVVGVQVRSITVKDGEAVWISALVSVAHTPDDVIPDSAEWAAGVGVA